MTMGGDDPLNVCPRKARTVLLLFLLLGFAGAHRFLVGRVLSGGVMAAMTGGAFYKGQMLLLVLVLMWMLLDFIRLLTGNFRDRRGRRVVNL